MKNAASSSQKSLLTLFEHWWYEKKIDFCSDEDSFKAEDSDECLNNSVGNLDEQIRNLSNQTIEFCQSIDEKAATKKTIEKSNNSESRPFIEVTRPEESNSDKVLRKTQQEMSKWNGNLDNISNIEFIIFLAER